MSEANRSTVLKFFEDARANAQLSAALAEAGSESEIAEVAKRHGYELNVADIKAGWSNGPETIDDATAAKVAGGVSDIDPLPALPVGSPGWRSFWRGYSAGHGGGDFGGNYYEE